MRRTRLVFSLISVGLVAGACSSSPSALHTTTTGKAPHPTTTMATGPVPNSSTTTTSGAPASSSTTSTIPFIPITGSVGEFYSPSRNISCEIDHNVGSGTQPSLNSVLCLTGNPPRAVVLTESGGLRICTGETCLSNAGLNTPVLQYGTATGAGPFRCVSEVTGMTCTVNGAQGFSISSSGITPIGGATIIAQGTDGSVLQ